MNERVAALLVGATLGTAEAAWVLVRVRSVSALDVTLLLLHGSVWYGLATAVLAACVARLRRVGGRSDTVARAATGSDAVGTAVTILLSAHFVFALARLQQPRLAWLIPGCILSGIACGVVARWVAERATVLHRRETWGALNAVLLLGVLVTVGLTTDDRALRWYVAGVIAALPAVVLLSRRAQGARAWRTVLASNGCLYGAVVVLPFAIAAFDRLHPAPLRSAADPPNVLLISVDTLRRDRLGCYGWARAHTPSIDRLAAEGALFEDASSPVPMTGPAHISMLTGLYPVHHGATINGLPIRSDAVTVAEMLSQAGYRTAAFVSGWTLKDRATSLAARFDHYDDDFALWDGLPDAALRLALPGLAVHSGFLFSGQRRKELERPGNRTTARVLAWLSRHRGRPFLVFAHYFDPHTPYGPPPPYDTLYDADYRGEVREFRPLQPVAVLQRWFSNPRDVEHIKALYDGEISYADAEVGRLLSGLAALGLAEQTLVIFTSDHGESLTEHHFYFDHAEYLYETCVHVPLIVRFPDGRYGGTRWRGPVRLVDLAPTIVNVVGVHPAGAAFDGRSLLPILNGAEAPGQRISLGATHKGEADDVRARYYVRDKGYKLIWNFDRRAPFSNEPVVEELYDLAADPEELQNLIARPPPALDALRDRLRLWVHEPPPLPERSPSEDIKARLRALGYL